MMSQHKIFYYGFLCETTFFFILFVWEVFRRVWYMVVKKIKSLKYMNWVFWAQNGNFDTSTELKDPLNFQMRYELG